MTTPDRFDKAELERLLARAKPEQILRLLEDVQRFDAVRQQTHSSTERLQ